VEKQLGKKEKEDLAFYGLESTRSRMQRRGPEIFPLAPVFSRTRP
jgi:hypothetical protein